MNSLIEETGTKNEALVTCSALTNQVIYTKLYADFAVHILCPQFIKSLYIKLCVHLCITLNYLFLDDFTN